MRLYLVRHPQPQVARGICYGASDLPCEPAALEKAASMLQDKLPKDLAIISSPLQRCEHLAQVLQGLSPDLRYQTDARLAEMHFGAWEMQAWDAIAASELAAWTDDFAHYRCGGFGESSARFIGRVALRLRDSASVGQDQVWITHAGVIKALQWLRIQPPAWIEALFKGLAHCPVETCARPNLGGAGHDLRRDLWRDQLHARDWPQDALPWGQSLPWDWSPDWPRGWL
jgi:alpha-ribazole phosphatase